MMASVTRKASAGIRLRIGTSPVVPMAAVVLAGLVGCGDAPTGPEAAVRAWIQEGHDAAEARDRRALVAMISPAYTDARGYTRDDIEDLLRFYFLRQQKVALLTRINELRVIDGSAAEVVLDVGMAGTNDNVLGFSADAYRFEMELEKQDDDWLLITARWGEIGGPLR